MQWAAMKPLAPVTRIVGILTDYNILAVLVVLLSVGLEEVFMSMTYC